MKLSNSYTAEREPGHEGNVHEFYVIRDSKGNRVGSIILRPSNNGVVKNVEYSHIDDTHRGQGLVRQFLDRQRAEGVTIKSDSLGLDHTSTSARHMWESLGAKMETNSNGKKNYVLAGKPSDSSSSGTWSQAV